MSATGYPSVVMLVLPCGLVPLRRADNAAGGRPRLSSGRAREPDGSPLPGTANLRGRGGMGDHVVG